MTERFAFYGRVSTEDQQDPTSSKQWQMARAQAIIEPVGGGIVAEYFDIGQSRSLPWKRRPEAAALLEAIKDPHRDFEAIVIGEPARAFSGNQFGLTFPVLVHHNVELWVPEVGGKVDPGSDAHDLIMSLYGGMSKGERNRIKIRVRSAMVAQAQNEGRFLGGRPPYGYQLADAGAHPNPGKAADGKRLHRLGVDSTAAPVVQRIFGEYLDGRGYFAIAAGLTRDGIPSPSAHDPARNRHRDQRTWSKIAVRSILMNPRYTGHQVWNRQRRDEVLIDVEDVAAGYESRMRWNATTAWVWSTEVVHEPIVTAETFDAARAQMAAGSYRPNTKGKTRTTKRTYVLSGRVHCGLCGHRMQGNVNHDALHYRCKFTSDRAPIPGMDHPKNVYVRESAIVPKLDDWIGSLFAPENLDSTCRALAVASGGSGADRAKIAAAERKLSDCDGRMIQYRKALDSGADPVVVADWMAEVSGERLRAKQDLAEAQPGGRLTAKQVRVIVDGLMNIAAVLTDADPGLKAQLYDELGITVRYDPAEHLVSVESRPRPGWGTVSVGGGIPTINPPAWRTEWAA